MALSPVRAVAFSLLWAFWVSLITEASTNNAEVTPCTGWDVLTGCDDTKDEIFQKLALGTIPGADADLNAFFAIIGIACRLTGIWGLMELIRGS